jgi:hypothetical protein
MGLKHALTDRSRSRSPKGNTANALANVPPIANRQQSPGINRSNNASPQSGTRNVVVPGISLTPQEQDTANVLFRLVSLLRTYIKSTLAHPRLCIDRVGILAGSAALCLERAKQ